MVFLFYQFGILKDRKKNIGRFDWMILYWNDFQMNNFGLLENLMFGCGNNYSLNQLAAKIQSHTRI